ncbi:NuA4 histone H4 acetyltransferase complex and the SWR1 complex subunit [Batrachochytrium dendrobatidis]|nr:NuA4 histone H4 acetyltransferase complex and the SWR1 complex subunit [Batrachochytrium dendrobatidis]
MSKAKRVNGLTVSVPFLYGSTATAVTKKDALVDPTHTHKWAVYVRGINDEDLSYCIKRVLIKLHESFESPNRVFEAPPYEVNETGWGEFEIMIKITLVDPLEKPITVYHQLQLYPKEEIALQSKKSVIVNHYDELPSEEYAESLKIHAELSQLPPTGPFSLQTEADELQQLEAIYNKLNSDLEKQNQTYRKTEQELRLIQAELVELERQ